MPPSDIPDQAPNRWVVCAANRHRQTGRIVCGARHFDSIMRSQMMESGGFPFWRDCDQGFIDQKGAFMTREQAYDIAKANGQIRWRCGGDNGILYSENLY